MNIIEFRRHPAYKYYIETLVYNCLLSDLEDIFGNNIKFVTNSDNNITNYIIIANSNIADEVEERLQYYLNTANYIDLYYVRKYNEFYFYIKSYEENH